MQHQKAGQNTQHYILNKIKKKYLPGNKNSSMIYQYPRKVLTVAITPIKVTKKFAKSLENFDTSFLWQYIVNGNWSRKEMK